MQVTGYETWIARVPYEQDRAGTHLILRLTTDEGLQGIAYATLLVPWTPTPLRAAVEAMAEHVVGQDPMGVERINDSLLSRATRPQFDGLARSAVSLIDIALWDLKARALGQPLWRLLGGQDRSVPVYASWNLWWQYDLDTLARHAEEHLERGFRAMKFRLGGVRTIEESVARARLLREVVGDDVALHVDMNWSWTVDQTIATGRELAPYRLFWIEDPIPAHDYEGMRQISQALETPICTGETYHEPAQFRALLDRRGAEVVMIDLEVGGITQWLRMAHLVGSYGVPFASHMCTEVSAHVVAATGALTLEYIPWAEPLFTERLPIEDGRVILSDRPGLGLELDMDAMNRYVVS